MISQENKSGLRNPWLLGMLFLIVLVLGVNITFIWYSANSQRSTLVERDYKTRDRKTTEAALKDLGEYHHLAWQMSINKPKEIAVGKPVSYEIRVTDKAGAPVAGGVLEVEAYRASDASRDFTVPFQEVAPGSYQGAVTYPLKGYWELHIRIQRGEDKFQVSADRFKVADSL
jgi:nitrogen fixation protein FixH